MERLCEVQLKVEAAEKQQELQKKIIGDEAARYTFEMGCDPVCLLSLSLSLSLFIAIPPSQHHHHSSDANSNRRQVTIYQEFQPTYNYELWKSKGEIKL